MLRAPARIAPGEGAAHPATQEPNNIVTISPKWKAWLRLGNIGFKNISPTRDKFRREEELAPLRGNLLGQKDAA